MKNTSLPKQDWKSFQVFGDKASSDNASDEDIISAIQFDHTGQYLSLGDRAGRLIVFEVPSSTTSKKPVKMEYQYLTELQSHTREFDFLKSTDIEEKINQVKWLRSQGQNLYVLSTNDKTVKLWKLSQKCVKKILKPSGKELAMPKLQVVENSIVPSIRKVFPNLHNYHINSLSVAQNEEFVLTSDDLKVYLWSIEQPSKAFISVDLKPTNLEELSEVITSSTFHPTLDSMFLYTTSKGIIKLCDMRKSGVCDSQAIQLSEHEDLTKKNFFTEIVTSISDACFSSNGKYVFSRDFLTVKVWDLAMTSKPVTTVQIFEPLKSKLCDLYDNECIFDKFQIKSTIDSNNFITGNFNNNFHIVDRNGEFNMQYELNFNKKTISRQIPPKFVENLGPTYDFTRKVLKNATCPTQNLVAFASLNCLYFYNLPQA